MITVSRGMSKGRAVLMLLSLFLASMVTMADVVLTPIVNNLYIEFASYPEWIINFSLTGGALISLVVMMLSGKLCDKMDKKIILVLGFALFAVGSTCGGMIPNAYFFLGMRMLVFVGWGFVNTANFAIIAEYFTDEKEHGKVVGWYSCFMGIMGASMSFASGQLATSGWQNAFYAYMPAFVVLLMLVVFVPKFPPTAQETAAQAQAGAVAVPSNWWRKLVPLSIQIVFVVMVNSVALIMVSLFVADAGIGDEGFSGMLAAIITAGNIVGSLLFGKLFAKLHNAVYLPALFIIAASFLLMAAFPSQPTAIVSMALIGVSYPMFYSFFYTHATEIVPASKIGTGSGVAGTMESLGYALSSYAVTGLMMLLGTGSCVAVWPYFGVLMGVVAVVSLCSYLAGRKKGAVRSEEMSAEQA